MQVTTHHLEFSATCVGNTNLQQLTHEPMQVWDKGGNVLSGVISGELVRRVNTLIDGQHGAHQHELIKLVQVRSEWQNPSQGLQIVVV